jgi:hypothetical protein
VASDKSDYVFATEVVKLTYPNGNEILKAGIAQTITWRINSTVRPIGKVVLYEALEENNKWKHIIAIVNDNGTYDGWIPNVHAQKIKIILEDRNGRKIGSDTSDWYFTVSPP